MLLDGQAVDVRKILVDPDAPKLTIGEGQANGRVSQHRVHLGRTLGNSPLQRCVEAFDLLFHLLQFGDIDQDPVPEDLTDGQPPGPGMQSHSVRFAIGSTNRQLDVKDREFTG